jgi:hypothetical protein
MNDQINPIYFMQIFYDIPPKSEGISTILFGIPTPILEPSSDAPQQAENAIRFVKTHLLSHLFKDICNNPH